MTEAGGPQPNQFEAPAVKPEAAGEKAEQAVEAGSAAQEASPGKQAPAPVLPQLPVIPDVPTVQTAVAATDQPVAQAPAKIQPADLKALEKQAIAKAKTIVAQTKSDPFKQKNEISKVKADYIQKRFNKVIKTDGAVAG